MRAIFETTVQLVSRRISLLLAVLVVALLWSYWPVLAGMTQRWETDSRYAHGYLVPAFALALLWIRRSRLEPATCRPNLMGLVLILVGSVIRLAGAVGYIEWLDAISLLPTLAGIVLLLGGVAALRWAWPSVMFLAFMIPLPFSIEMAMGWPLQRLATEISTYALQTCGIAAVGEGNVIVLESGQIGVVEACSGLSMLILFFAIATGVALVVSRPLVDRLLIVASAIPIALIANITRITVTGLLQEAFGAHLAHLVFHDLAGYLMMPLALLMLWTELALLARLLIEVPEPSRRAQVDFNAAISEGRSSVENPARKHATRLKIPTRRR
jgi:exosortase